GYFGVTGDGWNSGSGFIPGSGNSASISDCKLNASSSATRSGNALTVNFVLSFAPNANIQRGIWVSGSDWNPSNNSGTTLGWQNMGTWNVPPIIFDPGGTTISPSGISATVSVRVVSAVSQWDFGTIDFEIASTLNTS